MKDNLIKEKSYAFALKIIELYKLMSSRHEYVLSRQLLKSGTSIGANVEEALAGQSRADFLSKMSIASKEARESKYWLALIVVGGFIEKDRVDPLVSECNALIKIMTSIVKTTSSTKNQKLRIHN